MTVKFIVSREAWWYDANKSALGDAFTDVLNIIHDDWEFMVVEVDLGRYGDALQVKVFDDAWKAFDAIPEFFEGLADLGKGATVEDIIDLMVSLGFTDGTERETPARYRKD
ncbi:hypothetical protein [Aeromicrobium sp. 179-A 4D2 NHS]|uniref:hypothetical protein n=1 Tax=Aeromicrobium sp. 179-A 4D2 NHS TaxID=3142375 RepID=UPI0039A3F760